MAARVWMRAASGQPSPGARIARADLSLVRERESEKGRSRLEWRSHDVEMIVTVG